MSKANKMDMRPKLLDLFCGAGGAAMGYHRAGFEVVGVDFNDQPNFPFEFHRADATNYPPEGFDAIHASPPCQAHTCLKAVTKKEYDDPLVSTRDLLLKAGKPWVIENVEGAPLINPITLCGSAFGLTVDHEGELYELRRHRLFESSVLLWGAPPCNHGHPVLGVYGDLSSKMRLNNAGRRPTGDRKASIGQAEELMGIDWMKPKELVQAIPPAYTEWIGKQILKAIRGA